MCQGGLDVWHPTSHFSLGKVSFVEVLGCCEQGGGGRAEPNYGAGQCESQDSALQEAACFCADLFLPLLCVLRVVVESTPYTSLSAFSYPKVYEGRVWTVCCGLCFPREF